MPTMGEPLPGQQLDSFAFMGGYQGGPHNSFSGLVAG